MGTAGMFVTQGGCAVPPGLEVSFQLVPSGVAPGQVRTFLRDLCGCLWVLQGLRQGQYLSPLPDSEWKQRALGPIPE